MSEEITVSVVVNNNRLEVIKALRYATGQGIQASIEKLNEILAVGSTTLSLTEYPDKPDRINRLLDVGFVVDKYPTHVPMKLCGGEDGVFIHVKKDSKNYILYLKTIRYASGYGLREAKAVLDDIVSYDIPVRIPLDSKRGKEHCINYLIGYGFTVTGYIHECFKGEDDLFKI